MFGSAAQEKSRRDEVIQYLGAVYLGIHLRSWHQGRRGHISRASIHSFIQSPIPND